jgi:hypothetical protein
LPAAPDAPNGREPALPGAVTPPSIRWRIRRETLYEDRSVGGPDYESEWEWQIIDTRTGAVVMTFAETLEEPFMAGKNWGGAREVKLSDDGAHVVVTEHDGLVTLKPLPQ